MLANRFTPPATGAMPGFHLQHGVLKANRLFLAASPACPAQHALSDIERYLCLTKRGKSPSQLAQAGHYATGLNVLTGNVHQRTTGEINLVSRDKPERPRRLTASAKRKIKPGKRQQPFRVTLCFNTDKTNAVLRVPEQQLIHAGRALSKRPDKRISTQKALSRHDAGNGPGRTDKQAVAAFNTPAVISQDARVRNGERLRGTSVRTGAAGGVAKAATNARVRHVHRRDKR